MTQASRHTRRTMLGALTTGAAAVTVGLSAPAHTVYVRPVPLLLLQSQLAGFHHHQGPELFARLRPGQVLNLIREPENPYDPRAVAVYTYGHKLGYIPKRDNAVIAQLIDRKTPLRSVITQLLPQDQLWERIKLEVYLHG